MSGSTMGLSGGRVGAESLVHDRRQRPRNDAGSNGLDRFVTTTSRLTLEALSHQRASSLSCRTFGDLSHQNPVAEFRYVLRYWCGEFSRSAFKHGFSVDEIMHAIATAVVIVDLDADADPPKVVAIGTDQSGRWLESIWLRFGDRDVVIQAMSLRKVFHGFLDRGDW